MHIYFKVQSTCDIHSYISFTKDTEIEDSSRSFISDVRDKLARVPVTFEDRSFWKPMRRDGGDRRIPRSPRPMPGRLSFTPLSSDRFQDWDTDNADDRCRTRRTENRWWQGDGVEHRRRLIYFVGRHVLVSPRGFFAGHEFGRNVVENGFKSHLFSKRMWTREYVYKKNDPTFLR